MMTTFRELHHGKAPLVLPNAWDVGSALAFATAGYPAVGTTSFGMVASAGMPDGGRASKLATIALVGQLSELDVHVTADLEDGYSDDPADVAEYVAELASLGVVGINLEDSTGEHLVDPAAAAAKISAVKHGNPGIFINARVDNFWVSEQATIENVLSRARRYEEAGADGIFVPGLARPEDIRAITAGISVPVNVLAHPTLTVAELGALGVRRVSSGSLPYRRAVDAAIEAVNALRDGHQLPPATPYWDMQARLVGFRQNSAETP